MKRQGVEKYRYEKTNLKLVCPPEGHNRRNRLNELKPNDGQVQLRENAAHMSKGNLEGKVSTREMVRADQSKCINLHSNILAQIRCYWFSRRHNTAYYDITLDKQHAHKRIK